MLVVDDDPMDAGLTVASLREAGVEAPVVVVDGADAAADRLIGRGRSADHLTHPPPRLVLLAWSVAGVRSEELLRRVRATPGLRRIPVIVLASPASPAECARAYDAGATSCIEKPLSFSEAAEVARGIRDYWLDLNTDPPDD